MSLVLRLILVLGILISVVYEGKAINTSKIKCEGGDEFVVVERGKIAEQVRKTSQIPVVEEDLIVVDTWKLQLIFFRSGQILKTFPVAIGKPETPTPIGEFKIIHKGGNWGDGFGVRWIGLNVPWGIYGIHGTNKPESIGNRASHGCIRMYNKHVLELYDLVRLGTPVTVVGDLPRAVPRRVVICGNTGKDVVAFQLGLRNSGFNPGAADGRFGPLMEQTVKDFQFFYGLEVNGRLELNEQYLLRVR